MLILISVAIAALNLRPAITVVGSTVPDIVSSYGASAASAGLLTALPGFCFALFGLIAVPISRKCGLSNALLLAAALTLLGQLARPFMPTMWAFVLLTGVAVAGIALTNVLLPAWIKAFGGKQVVLLMTIYTAFLGFGSAVAPLTSLFFPGAGAWRYALLVWVIPVVVQLALWAFLRGGKTPPASPTQAKVAIWRSPTAVWLMLFFGLQSMTAYVQMGWLPTIILDAGGSPTQAAVSLSLLGVYGFIGGLVVPFLLARVRQAGYLVIIFAACTVTGYGGFIFAPLAAPYLWASLLGIGGFCFVTAIALIPARSRDHHITARLSGFVQPVGYLMAAGGPLLVGVVYGAVGNWTGILVVLAAFAVLMGATGFLAGRNRVVDDELAGNL